MTKLVARSLVLVAAGFVVGLAYNSRSPKGIDLRAHPLQAASQLESGDFLDLASARTKFESGVTFVDARAEDFYLVGHIWGAVSLPVADFDSAFPRVRERLLPVDREIVCYCSGFGCEESIELAEKLRQNGFNRVYVFLGGWPEWSEGKLPAEVSE